MIVRKAKRLLGKLLLRSHPVWSRLIPSFFYPYGLPGGRIYLDITESHMMLARALGRYEPSKHDALRKFLPAGGTLVDVGVNKGDFTLLGARIAGQEGTVLAFEPEPRNCHWIKKSLELNGYENVRLFEMALSDENGTGQLHLGRKSGWHSLIPGSDGVGVISVETRRLDDCLSQIDWDGTIDVLKIDVEGADLRVLSGASETLANTPNITVLLDIHPHLGVNPREVLEYLTSLGFEIYEERPPFDVPVADDGRVTSIVARRGRETPVRKRRVQFSERSE